MGATCLECDEDSDCEGGYCDIGGACNPLRGLNQGCGRDGMCESGLCNLIEGCQTCRENGDCPAGDFCFTPVGRPNECITPRPNGSACEVNAMCQSNTCIEGECRRACNRDADCPASDWCHVGGCKPKLANSLACVEDRVCQSGICDLTCVACIRGEGCAANQYCDLPGENDCRAKKANGQACSGAFECTGGACIDGRCRTDCNRDADCPAGDFCHVGGCVDKLANGAACVENRVCESNVCDVACVDCVNDGQCGAGEVCVLVGVNSCERPRANGAACSRDVECAGWCDVGTCKATVGAEVACSRNAVCTSGVCEIYFPAPWFRCR
ncbi:MAG: hypothetical protein H6702_18875 [Myxococcales bacterium]|nr:hypothetical protein [Myxococcales bacterium]